MRIVKRLRWFLYVSIVFQWTMPTICGQSISISEELILRNDYAYTVLGWVKEDLLLFRDKGHQFFIQAFDKELRLKWEREVVLGEGRADIIGIVTSADRFHLIFGIREKGDYYIRHSSFNHDINVLDTATIDVLPNVFMAPRILMKESEDKHKVLLYQEENNIIRLYSYDLEVMTVLSANSVKLETAHMDMDLSSLVINNEGEFFLPVRNQQKGQNLNIFYSVFDKKKIVKDTISLGDVELFDLFPVYDHVHQCLVVTGLYGDRNSTRANGFYFIRYRTGSDPEVHMLPFDESLLTEVNGRNVDVSRGLSDFTVQRVALRQDGGAVVIAELVKEFSRRSSLPMQRDNGSFVREGWVDYYFEDIILFAINPDGTEHWKEVLRKRQYSQDDDAIYSSFFLFKTPERLRFLFNDEIKQENTVGGYEVTGKGYIERKTVFNTDYQRLKLRFRDGIQVANNECIVPSERNNKLNLVRIVYNEE